MKYMKYIICLNVFCFFGFAQTPGTIEKVSATIVPKVKKYQLALPGGEYVTMRKDTGYTMIILVKTDNLDVSDKLVIKIGEQQNDDIALNFKAKVVAGNNNQRAIHTDDTTTVKISDVLNGYVQLYFDFQLSDYTKLKWVTAFVKNGNVQSQKQYYGFQ